MSTDNYEVQERLTSLLPCLEKGIGIKEQLEQLLYALVVNCSVFNVVQCMSRPIR